MEYKEYDICLKNLEFIGKYNGLNDEKWENMSAYNCLEFLCKYNGLTEDKIIEKLNEHYRKDYTELELKEDDVLNTLWQINDCTQSFKAYEKDEKILANLVWLRTELLKDFLIDDERSLIVVEALAKEDSNICFKESDKIIG